MATPRKTADGKHTLATKGAWVKLLPEADLRAKHRNRAMAARSAVLRFDPVTGKPRGDVSGREAILGMLDSAQDVAAMLVTEWNIPYLPGAPLPIDHPDLIGELTIADCNRLLELTAPTRKTLLDPPEVVDPSDYEDEASPTVPESD